jgi:rare lipoprotein A
MPHSSFPSHVARVLIACTFTAGAAGFALHAHAADGTAAQKTAPSHRAGSSEKPKLDLSGRKRVGKASFYAKKFAGRKMADGTRMDPGRDNAASKTLPLGTRAKVTNLETGKSAVVTIKDRGPYAKDRIVDLSSSTAQKVGITRDDGVAKVEVVPIAVPQPDGGVKPGVGAQDAKTDKPTARDKRE